MTLWMRAMAVTVLLGLIPAAILAAGATKVVRYEPFDAAGLRPGFSVKLHASGYCWVESLASSRRDAWRCMIGNSILDPCFVNMAKTQVACPTNAFAQRLVMLRLTKPLPHHSGTPDNRQRPWALRLTDGERCFFVTGATGVIAGMRLNYACNGNAWVIGEPEQTTQPWHALFAPDYHKQGYRSVGVAEAIL